LAGVAAAASPVFFGCFAAMFVSEFLCFCFVIWILLLSKYYYFEKNLDFEAMLTTIFEREIKIGFCHWGGFDPLSFCSPYWKLSNLTIEDAYLLCK
jgi:hypothetical protein